MPVLDQIPPGEGRHVPVKIWTPAAEVEPGARAQLEKMARLPFLFKHIAVMPDVHLGKGATVGSVVATKEAVIPAAVGVDIGCGMMAVQTDLDPREVQSRAKEIRRELERVVPVGHESHSRVEKAVESWQGWQRWEQVSQGDRALLGKAMHQLGTLGGGNHFLELCLDEREAVWVVLHSGSRNLGKTLAERHIGRAKSRFRDSIDQLPDPDLAFFLRGTREYRDYMTDLLWAQEYAFENRKEMMRRALHALARLFREGAPLPKLLEVNCHHNYAQEEEHFGENVLVTRKGAVRAREGEYGIIPGSMGASTFIVRGKGNAESFCSCSHGAGRRMSRAQAKKSFSVDDLRRQTAGVECRKDAGVLDEIPGAYKDIEEVMARQSDLVEVVARLKQVLCVKG